MLQFNFVDKDLRCYFHKGPAQAALSEKSKMYCKNSAGNPLELAKLNPLSHVNVSFQSMGRKSLA